MDDTAKFKGINMSFLEASWEERETTSYKALLGDTGPGIFPLSHALFKRMNASDIAPRWLTHGVFKSPPNSNRNTWAYITSGMSNPWETDEPEEYSGLGVEFLMETEKDETWAVEVLQMLMAYNLLLAAGQMGDFPLLGDGDRVPLALSDAIRTMMFTEPVSFPHCFNIKSGRVDLLQVVGITPAELQVAKQTSSDEIRTQLISKLGTLVTSKERESVV
ncbi:suppressor of fused domain protein [Shewanella seohaensis]|uniref:suppressor of fused domain protein n=2 Tax=Shewanella seohaensis TaxID=755175 RepID=UPI0021C74CC9|nr:suppressor of fused domain protein [Shewanella seohaensis]UXM81534.1 suppressor of fused domain protein [Shewanella seohaensis]